MFGSEKQRPRRTPDGGYGTLSLALRLLVFLLHPYRWRPGHKMAREVTEEQTQDIARGVRTYVERAAAHRKTLQIDS
jgi:hypothetical protein